MGWVYHCNEVYTMSLENCVLYFVVELTYHKFRKSEIRLVGRFCENEWVKGPRRTSCLGLHLDMFM